MSGEKITTGSSLRHVTSSNYFLRYNSMKLSIIRIRSRQMDSPDPKENQSVFHSLLSIFCSAFYLSVSERVSSFRPTSPHVIVFYTLHCLTSYSLPCLLVFVASGRPASQKRDNDLVSEGIKGGIYGDRFA